LIIDGCALLPAPNARCNVQNANTHHLVLVGPRFFLKDIVENQYSIIPFYLANGRFNLPKRTAPPNHGSYHHLRRTGNRRSAKRADQIVSK